jgi:hypothetical protein
MAHLVYLLASKKHGTLYNDEGDGRRAALYRRSSPHPDHFKGRLVFLML